MAGENVLVAIVTAVGTYFMTQAKIKHEVKGKIVESDASKASSTIQARATTEGMYIESMELILTEYKEQVASFREEVQELRKDNKELKAEFDTFRAKHKDEVAKYEIWVIELQEENEDLLEENTGLKEQIREMEGIQ